MEKALRGKVKATFPLRLEIPQKARDSHFPTAPAATGSLPPSKSTVRMSYYDVCGVGGQVRPGSQTGNSGLLCRKGETQMGKLKGLAAGALGGLMGAALMGPVHMMAAKG